MIGTKGFFHCKLRYVGYEDSALVFAPFSKRLTKKKTDSKIKIFWPYNFRKRLTYPDSEQNIGEVDR